MEETHKKGWLSGVFKKALYIGTIGLAIAITGNLFWQTLLDPLFFPVIHDPTNQVAQGMILFMRDNFGFLLDWIGLTGGGGLLGTDLAQGVLEPYMEQAAVPGQEEIYGALQGGAEVNLDGVSQETTNMVDDFLMEP